MDKQNETKQASGFKLGFNKKFSHVKEAYLISPIMVANVDMTRIQGGRFEHGENQRWQLIMSPLSFTSFLF